MADQDTEERIDEAEATDRARHQQLCEKISKACVGSSYDDALLALTSVIAGLCTETPHPDRSCLSATYDLIDAFDSAMTMREQQIKEGRGKN